MTDVSLGEMQSKLLAKIAKNGTDTFPRVAERKVIDEDLTKFFEAGVAARR